MDNQETLATLSTQDTGRKQNTKLQHRKLKRWATPMHSTTNRSDLRWPQG